MIYSYIRVSTDSQLIQHQKEEINRYCNLNNLSIDETIEVELSSRKDARVRRIHELVSLLKPDDILIITELSRLGRDTGQVINLIDTIINKNVEVRILKQNLYIKNNDPMQKMMVTMLSMFSEFERDIISQRTKESLKGLKDRGIQLGKPKGVIQKSIFDKDRERIVELLELGLSYNKIINKHLKYGSASSLFTYIKKRNLLASL